ncbi:ABCB10 [Symbiodinium necroappetens]|uniref:ABCB10 protein n=1 Tax=Symbiodinium necroappetens TaxID=1628268 RepID=A0A813CAJ3_9DINO|nr:ABCB10 [Symbiodinium necroappetens]
MNFSTKRKLPRSFGCLIVGFLTLLSCEYCAVRSPPGWWKAGRARKRLGSVAEAELLSHLAVLLLPEEPIRELFRDFPAERNEGWSRNTLSPDLAVYGALQAQEAALFLEYDGYCRHLKPRGILADTRKSQALLDASPAGSYVLRIAHAHRGLQCSCEMGEVVIESWQMGRECSLVKALRQIVEFLLTLQGSKLQPRLKSRLQQFMDDPVGTSRVAAAEFTDQVATERDSDFDPAHLHEFLQLQLGLSPS